MQATTHLFDGGAEEPIHDPLFTRNVSLIETVLPHVRRLNRYYFRLWVEGFERIPPGPALFVANHNGGIAGPDLCCTLGTLWESLGPGAPVFALAHDFAMKQFTPLGALLRWFGAVRATRENALRILASGGKVLVYPGGDLEAYRLTSRRNEIVLGQRTGFVRVAQETGAPLVPIVAHGAHRSAYIFSEGRRLAKLVRLERWGRLKRFPFALAAPWGLGIGPWTPYLPLPFGIRLRMLPPMHVSSRADPARIREDVRTLMQRALDDMRVSAGRGR